MVSCRRRTCLARLLLHAPAHPAEHLQIPKRKALVFADSAPKPDKPPQPKKWSPFSPGDSRAIEATFQKICDEAEETERKKLQREGPDPGEPSNDEPRQWQIKERHVRWERSEPNGVLKAKVPVNEDFLFDVDVEERELAPAYWIGAVYEVRRGTWFFQGKVFRSSWHAEILNVGGRQCIHPSTVRREPSNPTGGRISQDKALALHEARAAARRISAKVSPHVYAARRRSEQDVQSHFKIRDCCAKFGGCCERVGARKLGARVSGIPAGSGAAQDTSLVRRPHELGRHLPGFHCRLASHR